jgi:cell division septum initiation protein DivIVA
MMYVKRMSTFETRVTDLRVMTEQQQTKVSSEIERINNRVTHECDKLRSQLEVLKKSNQEGNNGNDANTNDVMPDPSGGHASSNPGVNASNVNGHANSGPQTMYVNEVGLGGRYQRLYLSNDPSREMIVNLSKGL